MAYNDSTISISNITVNSALWAPGDEVTISFKLKNVSSKKITKMVLDVKLKRSSFTGETGTDASILLNRFLGTNNVDGESINLAAGKSKTFSATFTIPDTVEFYFTDNETVRAVPVYISYTNDSSSADYGGTDFEISGLHAINHHFSPQVMTMDLTRASVREVSGVNTVVPDDEGENVLTTLKLGMDSGGYDYTNFLSAKIYWNEGDLASTEDKDFLDLTSSIETLLAGVENAPNLITKTYSKESDWDFLLVFGDEYETFAGRFNLGRAFANMHLSGQPTGGVCFGGFSTSKYNNPKLESYYPAHLYGGIKKIGEDWTYLEPLTGSTPGDFGGGLLRCRKIENKCIVAGSLLVKPDADDTVVLAQLPEGYTPENGVFSINACYGSRVARIVVGGEGETNVGKLCLSWVKNLSDGTNYSAAAIWVQCSIEYWVPATQASGDTYDSNLMDANGDAVVGSDGAGIAVLSADGEVYQSRYTGSQIDAGIGLANTALQRSGGTMSGALTLLETPTNSGHAVTKGYVDSAISTIELTPGDPGKSAYEVALEEGFEGTKAEWLESLHGKNGYTPVKGTDYFDGANGKSAYEIALEEGFEGTKAKWLESLHGKNGDPGKSAFVYAQEAGYSGTESEFAGDLSKVGDPTAWRDIDGKPFGNPISGSIVIDGDTLRWDGNTDNMCLTTNAGYVYVSGNVPTLAEARSGSIMHYKYTSGSYNEYEFGLYAMEIPQSNGAIELYYYHGDMSYSRIYIIPVAGTSLYGDVFERPGVYFKLDANAYVKDFTIPGYAWAAVTELSLVPETMIPGSIARTTDVNTAIETLKTNLEAVDQEHSDSISALGERIETVDLDSKNGIGALREETRDYYDEIPKEIVWRDDAKYGCVVHDNYFNADFARVSNYAPPIEMLRNGNGKVKYGTDSYTLLAIQDFENGEPFGDSYRIYTYGVWVIAADNTVIEYGDTTTIFPKKGTYFQLIEDIYGNQVLTGLTSNAMQEQGGSARLKEEHMPELTEFVMRSSDGSKRFKITIDASGNFVSTEL